MADYFCRIITENCAQETETRVHSFFRENCRIISGLSPLRPYWKNPGQGEITCAFSSVHAIEEVRHMLADQWIAETAARERSSIFCPGAVFLWLTAAEGEENHG